MKDSYRMHIVLTAPQKLALEHLAKKSGLAVSEIIRRAIDYYAKQATRSE